VRPKSGWATVECTLEANHAAYHKRHSDPGDNFEMAVIH
jgi:hypothetical protein